MIDHNLSNCSTSLAAVVPVSAPLPHTTRSLISRNPKEHASQTRHLYPPTATHILSTPTSTSPLSYRSLSLSMVVPSFYAVYTWTSTSTSCCHHIFHSSHRLGLQSPAKCSGHFDPLESSSEIGLVPDVSCHILHRCSATSCNMTPTKPSKHGRLLWLVQGCRSAVRRQKRSRSQSLGPTIPAVVGVNTALHTNTSTPVDHRCWRSGARGT